MHMDEENRENEKSRHHCAYFTSLIIRSELAVLTRALSGASGAS